MSLEKARKAYITNGSETSIDRLVVAILETLQRSWDKGQVYEMALEKLQRLEQDEWLPVVARMEESLRFMKLAQERTGPHRKRYTDELKRRGLS